MCIWPTGCHTFSDNHQTARPGDRSPLGLLPVSRPTPSTEHSHHDPTLRGHSQWPATILSPCWLPPNTAPRSVRPREDGQSVEPATECYLAVGKGRQGHVSARMQGRRGVPSEASRCRRTHAARVCVHGSQQQAELPCGDGHQQAGGEKGLDWRGHRKRLGGCKCFIFWFGWWCYTGIYNEHNSVNT